MADSYLHAPTQVRTTTPLVQCLTNAVVMQFTANALLAIGASPAMVDTPAESFDFAGVADGVLINAGTPSAEQYAGMNRAVDGANAAGTPWVLDPVGVGGLAERSAFLRDSVDKQPAAIRGNASEIVALAGLGAGGRGVDATDEVADALEAAQLLARRTGGVVAVTGPEDLIVSEGRVSWLRSGDPMLQLVIGTGCSLGAVVGACLAVAEDRHDAVVAAHALFGAAGLTAARHATAPASFRTQWIDALHTLTPSEVEELVTTQED